MVSIELAIQEEQMSIVERPKAEIVARVLERIAEDRYHAGDDEGGELIIIPDYKPTLLESEEYLSEQLGELEKMREGSEIHHDDLALSENWSDFWTLRLLEQEPFGAEDSERLFPILKGRTYEEVIPTCTQLSRRIWKKQNGCWRQGGRQSRRPKRLKYP
jgi:hypothetical protein